MDVGNARVVHPAFAPRFGVQGAFKHSTENRRADVPPVKRSAMVHDDIHNLFREIRNLNLFIAEQASIHVWERLYLGIVFVALLQTSIQGLEQFDDAIA